MSEKIVNISVGTDGQAKIEADGISGESCKELTKPFEDIYTQEISHKDKPDLFVGDKCTVRLRAQ